MPETPPPSVPIGTPEDLAADRARADGTRMAKRKKDIARELATVRPDLVLPLSGGRAWVFPPVLPGDLTATVIYLDPAGAREEHALALADYKAFAEKMLATLKAAG